MVLAVLFSFGDVQTILDTPTGWPFIEVFRNAVKDVVRITVMASIVVASLIIGNFGFLAAASRQAWAFARDRGLPYSTVFVEASRRGSSLDHSPHLSDQHGPYRDWHWVNDRLQRSRFSSSCGILFILSHPDHLSTDQAIPARAYPMGSLETRPPRSLLQPKRRRLL